MMVTLGEKEVEATKLAAIITNALTWIVNNVPDALVPPELLPAFELVLQFERSGRWPDDLRAAQAMKLVFLEAVARCLLHRTSSSSTPQEQRVTIYGFIQNIANNLLDAMDRLSAIEEDRLSEDRRHNELFDRLVEHFVGESSDAGESVSSAELRDLLKDAEGDIRMF